MAPLRPLTTPERAQRAERRSAGADPLAALAARAQAGEAKAIQSLVMELGGGMLRTIRKVLGPGHADAEDVLQEAILGFLQSLDRFRGESGLQHYAQQIALRRALHARRHFRVRERVGELRGPEASPDAVTPETPLDVYVEQQRRDALTALLDRLPEPTAEALALHFMLGYTVAEIAELTAVSPNTVWSRIKLGKRALRTHVAAGRSHQEFPHE